MTDWQRNQHVADIGDPRQGGLEVNAARWPDYPGGKASEVMWIRSGRCEYLPAWAARAFATALIRAANEIEGRHEETPPPEG